MRLLVLRTVFAVAVSALLFAAEGFAQQTGNPPVAESSVTEGNAGQASSAASATPSVGDNHTNPASAGSATAPASAAAKSTGPTTEMLVGPTADNSTANEDNPYDPFLEPPPFPKGNTTLVGGIAVHVDHVRNRITIQPFGKGKKMGVVVDARSHIYRNGAPTTILGVHKGDRIYVDTMLDGSKVLARNVRVITEPTIAEVRGQVIALHPDKGTVTVQDQLSAKPVSFSLSGNTKYTSTKGTATAADVQPGSLVDVQFATNRQDRDVAEEVTVLAKPGDDYIFSGTVTDVDMHSDLFMVDNRSDDQNYEVHFNPAVVSNARDLKIGSEVTARTVFDGKQYRADTVEIQKAPAPSAQGEQSKVE